MATPCRAFHKSIRSGLGDVASSRSGLGPRQMRIRAALKMAPVRIHQAGAVVSSIRQEDWRSEPSFFRQCGPYCVVCWSAKEVVGASQTVATVAQMRAHVERVCKVNGIEVNCWRNCQSALMWAPRRRAAGKPLGFTVI